MSVNAQKNFEKDADSAFDNEAYYQVSDMYNKSTSNGNANKKNNSKAVAIKKRKDNSTKEFILALILLKKIKAVAMRNHEESK